jgi:hypothetical protein
MTAVTATRPACPLASILPSVAVEGRKIPMVWQGKPQALPSVLDMLASKGFIKKVCSPVSM